MNITIQLNNLDELKELAALLPMEGTVSAVLESKPAETLQSVQPAAPEELYQNPPWEPQTETPQQPAAISAAPQQPATPQQQEAPQQPAAISAAPIYTVSELQKKMFAWMQADAGAQDKIIAALKTFGVPAVTDLREDQYTAFAEAIKNAGAPV